MNYSNHISIITDEISQDFEHALDVAAEYEINTVDVRIRKNAQCFKFQKYAD